jgi:hypothetical protein
MIWLYRLHTEAPNQSRPSVCQTHILTSYLLGVLIMWVSFNVVIVGALALGASVVPPMHLFSAYADVFPGQSESNISGRGFSCVVDDSPLYTSPFYEDCRLTPATGTFSRIDVMISNKTIHQISFIVRENTLRVGDLALLVESSDFRAVHNTIYFSWKGNLGFAFITQNTGRLSPFQYVWQVALTDMDYLHKTEDRRNMHVAIRLV